MKTILEFLEQELKPVYMNDVNTWGQIEKALKKYFEKHEPSMGFNVLESKKLFNEGIAKYFDSPYELAQRMFSDGMIHQFKKMTDSSYMPEDNNPNK